MSGHVRLGGGQEVRAARMCRSCCCCSGERGNNELQMYCRAHRMLLSLIEREGFQLLGSHLLAVAKVAQEASKATGGTGAMLLLTEASTSSR